MDQDSSDSDLIYVYEEGCLWSSLYGNCVNGRRRALKRANSVSSGHADQTLDNIKRRKCEEPVNLTNITLTSSSVPSHHYGMNQSNTIPISSVTNTTIPPSVTNTTLPPSVTSTTLLPSVPSHYQSAISPPITNPRSLQDACLRFIAVRAWEIQSLAEFPEQIAERIFTTVKQATDVVCNPASERCQGVLRTFDDAYPSSLLSSVSLRDRMGAMIGRWGEICWRSIYSFNHLVRLDVSGIELEEELIQFIAHSRRYVDRIHCTFTCGYVDTVHCTLS